eukprot:GEMP01102518.1.p1 GENE.GEMP01102518.1~~GEMP01102518.1.p1  ORF type:complete len:162 (+),score=22.52 GEMP01102518.1:109-594(+)
MYDAFFIAWHVLFVSSAPADYDLGEWKSYNTSALHWGPCVETGLSLTPPLRINVKIRTNRSISFFAFEPLSPHTGVPTHLNPSQRLAPGWHAITLKPQAATSRGLRYLDASADEMSSSITCIGWMSLRNTVASTPTPNRTSLVATFVPPLKDLTMNGIQRT